MEARERVLTALAHREPDRVPIDLGSCGPTGIHVNAYADLLKQLGRSETLQIWDEIGQLAKPSEAVLDLLGADVRGIRVVGPKDGAERLPGDRIRDQWGIVWQRPKGATCYNIAEYPLRGADRKDLVSYPWPDPADPQRVVGLAEEARRLHEETPYAVLGEISGHILERGQMLCGFDTFLEDLALRPGVAEEVMDRVLEVEVGIVSTFLNAVGPYLDVIAFKDDIGMQSGPVISPAMFRRMIKPRLKQLVEVIRGKTRARVWFHSCGSVYYAIPDLIEIGIDILNPIQVAARDMDTARLKREFGADLVFWGAIDTQSVLPFGTPEDVETEVKRRLRDLGPGGGYVLASVHNIEADVPAKNILAMSQAAQHWGCYPLNINL